MIRRFNVAGRWGDFKKEVGSIDTRNCPRQFLPTVELARLVPAVRFELTTYGLQNRCTTTVLSRRGSRTPL